MAKELEFPSVSSAGTHRSLKGPLEAGQLIQDTAQSPDVTLLVVGLALTQLRGDVAWSTYHL